MLYKCDCCGFVRDFETPEDAFNAGYDAEPNFYGYVACDLCPAASQFLPGGWARHQPVHERWEREGRPASFDQETCVLPEDRATPEQLAAVQSFIESLDPEKLAAAVERIKLAAELLAAAQDKELKGEQ